MAWTSRVITATGVILLAHACYSAQEHATLTSGALQNLSTTPSLPIDISLETIAATLIICFGLVLGSPTVRPIQWPAWAGKIEREGEAGFISTSGEVEKDYRGNPFALLEARSGFVDIRKQRREFTSWMKSEGK